jgi:adenosylcobinamide-GDP ribazoletransferase
MITQPLTHWIDRTLIALAFLSRIPVPSSVFVRHPDLPLAGSAAFFPLAAILITLPAIAVLLVSSWLQPELSTALALATLAMTTGALHEDGLADCADAFFAPVSRERRLEIMKDSRIGTFGGLALIVQFVMGWSALSAIVDHSAFAGVAALLCVSAMSRAGVVWHWHVLPFARPGGLAESQGRPTWGSVLIAASLAGTTALIVVPWAFGWLALAMLLATATLATLASMILARGKIGGQTGDTLGMAQKLTEVFVLVALAGWVG